MENHDNELTFVLHDVARLMHVRFDQHARTWGMTRAQCVILIKLRCRPGLSQSELATLMEVEPISVVRLIDRLEAAGMVERRPDPCDRRMHRLHLLSAAEPALAKVEMFREGIPGEDWDTALRVLMQIKDKMASEAMEDAMATAGE